MSSVVKSNLRLAACYICAAWLVVITCAACKSLTYDNCLRGELCLHCNDEVMDCYDRED